ITLLKRRENLLHDCHVFLFVQQAFLLSGYLRKVSLRLYSLSAARGISSTLTGYSSSGRVLVKCSMNQKFRTDPTAPLLSPIAPLVEEGQWPKRTLLSRKFRFKNKLVNLDSSVIDLCATPFSNFLLPTTREPRP